MIRKETFTLENIQRIQKEYKVDPELAQRTVFALGLVEALRKVDLQFIFKGGSSLMLLFDVPKRLSTDIDILVNKNCDIDSFINEVANIFPFTSVSESVRTTNKSISKKHYKFTYLSPIKNREITVLLDILFSDNNYAKTITKPINNGFLITEGEDYYVTIPTIESILGDKLCAFAPHTTGIKYHNEDFSNDKRLEVIKQFYDVVSLFDIAKDFKVVRDTYFKTAEEEIAYRNLDITPIDSLKDSFDTALSLLSWGKFNKVDYLELVDGVNKIKMHIVNRSFSMNSTAIYAAKVMLLSACLIKDVDVFNLEIKNKDQLKEPPYNQINFILKNKEQEAYNIAVTAIEILK
jgi:hypothetical protein